MTEEPPVPTNPSDYVTPQQATRQRIIERLIEKGGRDPQCPICHQKVFAIGAYVHLAVSSDASVAQLGRSMPCVTVMCMTCGNVLLVSLLALGFTREELAQMPNDA
jgi:hypothetical protein